jgi:peptidoglycan/xylan/chitin deacetylase (PgdA/CDA1 family)
MEALPAPGTRYVGITFDDGFENLISVALPELQRRNIPSTVFIILDALGNEFGTPELLEKVMSADQLRSIPQDLVTLGSHTLTHPFLPSLRAEEALEELVESRLQLEKILNRSVTLFSFPFGGFTGELVQLSRQAGYARVFTTLPRLAFTGGEQFAVGRIRADTTDWPLEFRLKIAGAYHWLPWAFAFKRTFLDNKFVALALGTGRKSKTGRQQIPSCLIRKSPAV